MKKYRIKPLGEDNEVGRVVFQDDEKIYLRLDIAPKQVYTLELMEDTEFLKLVEKEFPSPTDEQIDLTKIPL